MKKYIDDNYDEKLINSKFKSINEFLSCQLKYRNMLENLILQLIDENEITNLLIGIPKCNDSDYNFYHKDSLFRNGYLFIRNNIHVERLEDTEIEELNNLDIYMKNEVTIFLNKTFLKVMSEESRLYCYGIPLPENIVDSNGLVFELAYDRPEFKDISQVHQVDKAYEIIKDNLKTSLKKYIKLNVELIKYTMMPDLYKDEQAIDKRRINLIN